MRRQLASAVATGSSPPTSLSGSAATVRSASLNSVSMSSNTATLSPAEAIPLMGQDAYDAYRQKARDVAAIFTDATGIVVPDASLEPLVT